VTYAWADGRFTERYRVRTRYGGPAGSGAMGAPG
jgi:hypothetical protein